MKDVPNVCVYIDDVLVGSQGATEEELLRNHYADVCAVLEAFKKHQITAKGQKVHLFMSMIKFCGRPE